MGYKVVIPIVPWNHLVCCGTVWDDVGWYGIIKMELIG